jgi:catechol 2,3-dioxygenase-like lactoylglutathione lyase family enzyme
MITGMDHVALVVSDIQAMTAFYRDVCGLTVRGGRELHNAFASRVLGYVDVHVHIVMLAAEGDRTRLELIRYASPQGGEGHVPKNALGAGHVCFNVDELDVTYKQLSRAGMRFVASPTAEMTASGQTHSVCYAQDPEGNWIEFQSLSD